MVYKPKMKQVGGFGPQGVAKIEVNPNNTDQIRFQLKEKKWNPQSGSQETKEYKGMVKRSDCPEKVQKLIRPGVWFISVNKDCNKIFAIRPVTGAYKVTVDHFSSPEGQPPAPKMSTGQYPHLYFTVILRIVEGSEKGMEVPYTLRYFFMKDQEEVEGKMRDVAIYEYHPKSPAFTPLVEFCDVTGVWVKGPMPYRDNILPMLQTRMLEKARVFDVILADGQVKGVAGGSSVEDQFAPDVEE